MTYPTLPKGKKIHGGMIHGHRTEETVYTAEQMKAYVDLDRKRGRISRLRVEAILNSYYGALTQTSIDRITDKICDMAP